MTDLKARPAFPSRTIMAAASILALSAAAAAAESPAPAPFAIPSRAEAASALPAGDTIVKHLPAGRSELTFRGEMASRRFAIVLGRNEAARITTFQVALRNTVSLLPEHSAIAISVNGRTLAALPATAADKLAVLPVAVPPGLLVPGTNAVQITSTLTHRVDCSVPATYELWATLDPAQTGFLVPRGSAETINTASDLAAAPLAEGRHDAHPPPHERNCRRGRGGPGRPRRAGVGAPGQAGAPRPWRWGPARVRARDSILWWTATCPTTSRRSPRQSGFGIGHDPVSGRLVVEVDPDADENSRGTSAARTVSAEAEPPRDGFRKTFAQLGRSTEVFTGRRYEATIPVVLPPDFMSTNDRARVWLDGGPRGHLDRRRRAGAAGQRHARLLRAVPGRQGRALRAPRGRAAAAFLPSRPQRTSLLRAQSRPRPMRNARPRQCRGKAA